MSRSLEVGSKAPDFSCAADGDRQISLADYAGKKLVIYFYPKDDTPGCTTEAIEFTAKRDAFAAANTEIVGVSADSVEKHEKFITKHSLGVTLLSDPDQKMLDAYGVWVEKNMYGKKYMGIERATFVVGEDGKILHVWRKVRVKGHVDAVLEAVGG
ncbi:MAG: thioredoxin-dependent thiol peroxidase [Rhizobiales bacterium TMED83]|jgi:peroxiredoxin Q/BCP|nr:thioredoxin-dependent thiol peroxidase [Rhodobiaceae bacterium]RPF92499.1 MAG: thioredoxin-dependent thiol peroxidase [Rhizobiales bacterium TMED83]HCD17405.1 thioredoxin-dependent thiol peroxidase [Rhodobiaceae bacterium]|tara:strand:+ start:776 stop:1243 length:468 start_codon:yes stop_codon:yes gene_type:complete